MKFLILVIFMFFTSCITTKKYTWNNKKVSEKRYGTKLKKYTHQFVRNMKIDVVELNIVYDTLAKK